MSPVRIVYRVEHKDLRHGPFSHQAVLGRFDFAWNMPTTSCDRRVYAYIPRLFWWSWDLTPTYRHACRSMWAVRKWFGPSSTKLRKAGFVVRSYRVPLAAMDIFQKQVVFDPDLAVAIETFQVPR